jgi:hypothetical protein
MAEHGFDGGGGQILGRAPGEAPSKTSKTAKTVGRAIFEVFEGSVPGRIHKIEAAGEWLEEHGKSLRSIARQRKAEEAAGDSPGGTGPWRVC